MTAGLPRSRPWARPLALLPRRDLLPDSGASMMDRSGEVYDITNAKSGTERHGARGASGLGGACR
jgi:hypothetical protein